MDSHLSRDEIALYDRQIRLWGIGTQLRLRSAKLLFINLGSIGMEAVKNLVLGGIHSMELLDDSIIRPEDYSAQFFLPKDKEGELKLPNVVDSIKSLNSRVEININTNSFGLIIENDPLYFSKFDLVLASELSKTEVIKLNLATRKLNIPLYVTGSHGMFGYIITDLIDHTSESEKDMGNQSRVVGTKLNLNKTIIKVEQNKETEKEIVTVRDEFKSFENVFKSQSLPKQLNRRQMKRLSPALPLIFALFDVERTLEVDYEDLKQRASEICTEMELNSNILTDEYLELLKNQAFTEFAPTSAMLGGCLAQDVIQYLSKKESPINNVLILDGLRSEMPIYSL